MNSRSQLNTSTKHPSRLRADWGVRFFYSVGAGRFELPTSRSRTVRATKLRYAPLTEPVGSPTLGAENGGRCAVCQG